MAITRPGITDIKLLFARSGNRCAFPKCTSPLAEGDTLIGDVCHIKGKSPGGPRNDPAQSPEERHGYGNLILLCLTHHNVVDDDDETYTVERLHKMKAVHEARAMPTPDQEASRVAELFFHQGSNVASSGGVAASIIHAQNFNVHQPPVDTFMQTRRLHAIEHLWEIMRGLKKEFGDLHLLHTILTPREMDGFFKNGWPSNFYIKHYAARDTVMNKWAKAGCDEAEKERPFVSPRVWGAFFIIRAVYGRLGYLCEQSFKEHRFIDWRTDSGIDQQLRTTLPAHVIEALKKSGFFGVPHMIDHLEIQFMNAAGMNPT